MTDVGNGPIVSDSPLVSHDDGDRDNPSTTKRKHFKACLRCRKRKVRCPGGQPCANCNRSGHECQHDGGKKVFVTEAYLKELQSNREIRASTEEDRDQPSPTTEAEDEHLANPRSVGHTEGSTIDLFGGNHFVGLSSTWGFSWRVRRLMSTIASTSSDKLLEVDDVAYTHLLDSSVVSPEDAKAFPRETTERYLSNYVYHVAPVWYFFDDATLFEAGENQNQMVGSDFRSVTRHIQFNLVMAVGKLCEHSGKHERFPGESYLVYALSLIQTSNESRYIAAEPILVAQNYCLLAFYYHAINMRNDAYINVGKAMRIALTQGLHRIYVSPSTNEVYQEAHVRFWWSLYSFDLILAGLMGAPVSVRYDEITIRDPLPHHHFRNPTGLIQCTKIARLMATVLSEVYGTRSHDRAVFTRSIRQVLDGVDAVLRFMPAALKLDVLSTKLHVSRTSATLYLFLYQTLIVAIRPILFHLVELKVEQIRNDGSSSMTPISSANTKRLLGRMVDAAVVSMRIISSIRHQGQMQTFLAFDVTSVFSSAVILSLMAFISSKRANEISNVSDALQILKELSDQGNVVAEKRLYELGNMVRDLSLAGQGNILPSPGQLVDEGPDRSIHISNFREQSEFVATDIQDGYNAFDPGSVHSFNNLSWDDLSAHMSLDEDAMDGFGAFFSQTEDYTQTLPFANE